jgi:hypothetical protein
MKSLNVNIHEKWKGPLSFLRTGAVFFSVNLMEGSVGSK